MAISVMEQHGVDQEISGDNNGNIDEIVRYKYGSQQHFGVLQ